MKLRRGHLIALVVIFCAAVAFAASDAYFSSDQGGRVLTLKSGGEINIASGATLAVDSGATFTVGGDAFAPGPYVPITYDGQQEITATGAGNDITFTSPDKVITAATGAVETTGATQAYAATTTFAFDSAGSTDELGIAENSVSIGTGVAFRIVGGTAPPVACAAGTKGTFCFDTDINKFCACNGTNYVLMNDDSTTTGCS